MRSAAGGRGAQPAAPLRGRRRGGVRRDHGVVSAGPPADRHGRAGAPPQPCQPPTGAAAAPGLTRGPLSWDPPPFLLRASPASSARWATPRATSSGPAVSGGSSPACPPRSVPLSHPPSPLLPPRCVSFTHRLALPHRTAAGGDYPLRRAPVRNLLRPPRRRRALERSRGAHPPLPAAFTPSLAGVCWLSAPAETPPSQGRAAPPPPPRQAERARRSLASPGSASASATPPADASPGVTGLQTFLCGLGAGSFAKILLHPLDVVKKRFQASFPFVFSFLFSTRTIPLLS